MPAIGQADFCVQKNVVKNMRIAIKYSSMVKNVINYIYSE